MSQGSFFSGFYQPALIRILPFALFMAFVVASSLLPAPVAGSSAWDTRLVYVLRTFAVAALLLFFWRHYSELAWDELRRCEWVRALLAGGLVFVLWIALDQPWATVGGGAGFDPRDAAGDLDWFLIVPRLLGLAIIVPLMEELFWRSFIQRWIHHPQFLTVKPGKTSDPYADRRATRGQPVRMAPTERLATLALTSKATGAVKLALLYCLFSCNCRWSDAQPWLHAARAPDVCLSRKWTLPQGESTSPSVA
jgi:CAAX prenyl protease-like protein